MIHIKLLRTLNQEGFIPGPDESEDDFITRVEMLRALPKSAIDWKGAQRITEPLFDFGLNWVPAFYSKKGLPFWQGAAVWIENGIPSVQLRNKTNDELLAHEAVHAARIAFNEPRFEEFFAYLTSRQAWRRWLGPIFRHSWESYLFIILLVCSIGAQIGSIFFSHWLLEVLFFLPWVALFGWFCRLIYDHSIFSKCRKNLRPLVSNPMHVMLRLTDREIVRFGRLDKDQLRAELLREETARERLIATYVVGKRSAT